MPDYNALKGSELKALLEERGISYGDCVEKSEFVKLLVAHDQGEKSTNGTSPQKPKKSSKAKVEKEDKKSSKEGQKSGTPRVRKNSVAYKMFESEMSATISESDPAKLAKILATKWTNLSRADKMHWTDKGKAAGMSTTAASSSSLPFSSSSFLKNAQKKPDPTARISVSVVKKVVNLNDDVGNMHAETMHVVEKAAELFIGWMAEAVSKSLSGKSIGVKDYYAFLKSSEKLRFLRATVETTPQGNPIDDPSVPAFKGAPKAHVTPQPKKKKPEVSEDEDAPLNLKKPKLLLQPAGSPASTDS